jgi:D-beta-D-heptose 7-phosphate kinase/D-beta-D-heptose 1-phosphate adenosyltransferase
MRILLIGDDCYDVYEYGIVERISPEAPVPIFKSIKTESKPGMVSNVEKNLQELGCEVFSYKGKPCTKTRFIDIKSNQHIIRIDNDVVTDSFHYDVVRNNDFDAIVVVDYNKGFISYELVEHLRKTFTIPVFVDSKKTDLRRFNGCIVKINEVEYNNALSTNDRLIVTHSGDGVLYNGKYFSVPKIEIADVCGAGDTFLSSFVYNYLKTCDIDSSIEFAIKAAAITVKHMGVYAPTIEEILCD